MKYTLILFSSLIFFTNCSDSNIEANDSQEKTYIISSENKSSILKEKGDTVSNQEKVRNDKFADTIEESGNPKLNKSSSSNQENTTLQTQSIQEGQPIKKHIDESIEILDFHEYIVYSSFLKKHVNSKGNVNYDGIKKDISTLNTIITEFKNNSPDQFWSKNQRLAYWINAYNIFTIKLIIDNYPVNSIKDITEKPWHEKFIHISDKVYSLNEIENDIIRVQFNEPRIHFALNCASVSCPILMNSAFKASSLNYQLTKQTKNFLSDDTKNTFTDTEINISPVFDWYNVDFTKTGTLLDFLNKHRTEQLVTPTIKYNEYNWELNK